MSIIKECIRTVGRGERGRKPLTFEQAFQVMNEYLDGQVGDDQMAMLLMLIRVQNETQQEIAGFVKAFQSRVPDLGADVDWPCYAGKRCQAGPPWHLLAAKILATHGHRVVLHGYHEGSELRTHAEDFLAALNVPLASNIEDAQHALEQHNIVYLPLNVFAPQAEKMLQWKHRYGLRTPMNTVVRALNPGGGHRGIRGSFHPGFQQLHAEVEHELNGKDHTMVSFKGQSGESEYNPKVSQSVWVSTPQGTESHYWPERMLTNIVQPKACVFQTEKSDWGLMANTVVATLSAVLFSYHRDDDKAFEQAYHYWQNYCQTA